MPANTAPKTAPTSTLSGKRALICDDEGMILMSLSHALQDSGISVIGMVNNGEDAVGFAVRERPDLIFLDMRMSGMSGLDTAGHILGVYRPCIIMLTASDEAEYRSAARDVGASGYIIKPIFATALMHEVKRAWEALHPVSDETRRAESGA